MGNKAIRLKDTDGNAVYPCPYFPVGAIYMSVNNTNPSTFFGGTWEQIKDRFLLACGSSYSNGATGGSSSVTSGAAGGSTGGPSNNTSGGPSNNTSGSTTLTTNQIPAHGHSFSATSSANGDHKHLLTFRSYSSSGNGGGVPLTNSTYIGGDYAGQSGSGNHQHTVSGTTGNAGGGQGHTHTLSSHTHSLSSHTHSLNSHTHSVTTMPPYLAVYVWKRTA